MKFVTSLHCIDGRVQKPVINFLQSEFETTFVDCITWPGINKLLAEPGNKEVKEQIITSVKLSADLHSSETVFVSGHHDCGAHTEDRHKQTQNIRTAINFLKTKIPKLTFLGLWIDHNFKVHLLEDY